MDGVGDRGGRAIAAGAELLACLLRTFLMDSTLVSTAGGKGGGERGAAGEGQGRESGACEGGGGGEETAHKLMGSLDRSFGLSQLLALLDRQRQEGGAAGKKRLRWTREAVERHVRRVVAGGKFQWGVVFGKAGEGGGGKAGLGGRGEGVEEGEGAGQESLPVKMEICSGTGDWVVAQVRA